MEAQLKVCGGKLLIKLTAEKPKDLFREIAIAQNMFETDDACGLCHSPNIHFRFHTAQSFDYYSLECVDCGAQLKFGQHKNQPTLFPKRSDENGSLPNRGWAKVSGMLTAGENET